MTCSVAILTVTGCGQTGNHQPPTSAAATPAAAPRVEHDRHGDADPTGATSQVATLPTANWPNEVPTPPGTIVGSTHANATTWTVETLAPGSAAAVLEQTVARYRAAGFTTDAAAVLHNPKYRVTLAVESYDHSDAETLVVVAVTGR